MGQLRENFVVTRAAGLVLGMTFALGLGAAVCASPLNALPSEALPSLALPAQSGGAPVAPAPGKPAYSAAAFQAFGEGPALSVRKSFGQHDEDCVTVTQVKGADGRVYASRGMVCAQ